MDEPSGTHRPGELTVVGEGRASATPTLVVMIVTVESTAGSASQALSETGARMTNIQQAVMSRGVDLSDMQAIWVNAFPIYPQLGHQHGGGVGQSPGNPLSSGGLPHPGASTGPPGGGMQPGGFFASRGLKINVHQPHQIGEILDISIASGAAFSGIASLQLHDDSAVRSAALEKAQRDAHAKAQILASLLNRQLGAAISIIEESPFPSLPLVGGDGVASAGQAPGVVQHAAVSSTVPGEATYGSRVRVTYELA